MDFFKDRNLHEITPLDIEKYKRVKKGRLRFLEKERY